MISTIKYYLVGLVQPKTEGVSMKFNGISIPEGDGVVIEVHLDIQETTEKFTTWLESLGFEN